MENPEALPSELQHAVVRLEEIRKELFDRGLKNGLIAASACFAGVVVLFLASGEPVVPLLLMALGVFLIFYCIGSQSKELSARYKSDVIAPLVDSFCSGASYEPYQGISRDDFCNSGIFTSPDRYHSEDFVSGTMGQTRFCFSEVRAEERRTRTNGKRVQTYYVDIFRGFMFIADFHKDFSGYTAVRRDAIIKWGFGGPKRVKLENVEFENVFDVFSTDEIETRYILTPRMMERFVDVNRAFPGCQAAFRDSCVYIAIPDTTDHFEASVWRSVIGNRSILYDITVLRSLFMLIDRLDLNTRIWTKE